MPTTRIDVEAFRQDDQLLTVAVQDGDPADPQFKPFDMTVLRGMTLEEMGQTALDQPIEPIPDPIFDGTFDLVWHLEEIIDPESGDTFTRRALDSITKI